tara:strand:- start:7637 stop:8509 length:873 start_codon:yes stop_codon:yes gene_type:complete
LKIALFTKIDLNENNNHIFSIIESFIKNKIEFEIDVDSYDAISNLNNKFISDNTVKNFKKLNSNFDYVISVGGDGTILKSAKEIGELLIPIVGLNKGRLGFLANSKVEIIDDILNKLKKKEFNISERSIIKAEFEGLNKFALNEISVSRKNTTSLITIETKIDHQYLNTYWADGLIVSTPTGSTGYSLSCGGPIIMPDAKNFVLTPIAPHNLNARPLVISDRKKIEISINGRENECFISVDSKIYSISIDSSVIISKASHYLNMVEFKDDNYLNTLREKLMWGKDKRTEQ